VQVTDVKQYLAQSLAQVSQKHPGKYSPLAATMPAECQDKLQEYLKAVGAVLA
jgi:hypothetical protein